MSPGFTEMISNQVRNILCRLKRQWFWLVSAPGVFVVIEFLSDRQKQNSPFFTETAWLSIERKLT
jgi:hypothetical protein